MGDPCYEFAEVQAPARNGSWIALARRTHEGDWGTRISSVLVHHEDFDPLGKKYSERVEYIGVDSGQAGVFDSDHFGSDHAFYDRCCRATDHGCGLVPGGFVTQSGFGDGGYQSKIFFRKNFAEAVEIVFIPERVKV